MTAASLDAPRQVAKPLKAAGAVAYAIGSLGTGVFSTVPTVLLLYYCTETLAVPAALAAIAMFAPKAWSILWDPIVGAWSDRARTRIGRRRPFLAVGAVGVFVAFVVLFNAPAATPFQSFIWVAASYFGLATLYSMFAVPYVALPSELGDTPARRSSLVAFRITAATIGVLAGAALAPMLVEQFGGGRTGYARMAWVLAVVCFIAMLGPIVALSGRDPCLTRVNKSAFWSQFTAAARNHELRLLAASYILQIGASGAYSAMVPYIVTRVAGRSEGEIGVAMGLMLLAAVIATPLWGMIGRAMGERLVNGVALVLYAAALCGLGVACITQQPWPIILALFAATGLPFAATQVLPFVIQAHLAHRASATGAGGVEGAFAGAWTAVEKLGLAIGPMLAGLALSVIGPDFAVGAPLFIAAIPPILLLVAIAPLAASARIKETSCMRQPSDVRRIDEFVTYFAHTTPDAPACVLDDKRISYAELKSRIDDLAKALMAHGVKKGDRVATLTPPNPDYLVCFLATISIGAIWVGLNPRYRLDELKYVLQDSEPRLMLTRTNIEGRSYNEEIQALKAATPALDCVVALDANAIDGVLPLSAFESSGALVSNAELAATREAVDDRDPCLIIYTSGSTGKPKGALLHHHGIARFAYRQNQVWPVQPLVMLNYFPVNHAGCITDLSVPTLAAGGAIVFMEEFDAARSMELMQKERVTMWGSVPSVFQMQLALPDFERYDLSAVQLVVWEGAAAPEPLIKRLLQLNSRLATNYGMSETMASTALAPTDDIDALANTVGAAFPGVEIKLMLPDGVEALEGEPGEIWVRSDYNLARYWRRPEATAEAITDDGFFKTGDLALRRPDGKFRIVGRIKEMYKSGGYNVYPREVEAVIEDHPNVAAAAVVSAPDPVWQEVGVAYVAPNGGLDPAELERHCRARLANYKIPKRFVIEPNMPLLPIGKIDKVTLKARAGRGE